MSLNSFQERPQVSPDPPETPEKTVERHKMDVKASDSWARQRQNLAVSP